MTEEVLAILYSSLAEDDAAAEETSPAKLRNSLIESEDDESNKSEF